MFSEEERPTLTVGSPSHEAESWSEQKGEGKPYVSVAMSHPPS